MYILLHSNSDFGKFNLRSKIYFLLTFLEYIYKFGVLPGTGMPALVSFMKYFCTRLAT